MEFVSAHTIKLDKVENELDRFVLDFVRILERHAKYVIVSGYVAILFGRNRASEDVDAFVADFQDFPAFVAELHDQGYWILNEDSQQEAYRMLTDGLAIRIAKQGKWQPNFEIKFPKRDTDFYSLEHRVEVKLASGSVLVGSLELNIAFKLFLGSGKDIEDARFLYRLLRERLDAAKLGYFIGQLGVKKAYEEYLL
ncbi:MAG: hypothetical protein HY519_01715 [Candidatus Aenigmarchaeota archaeon]|nr:hypothetical protein [Candidatus Aenigmarchaeota archaeon]